MTDVYIVTQAGIQNSNIFGVFTAKEKAIEYAKELANTDVDNYHAWCVTPYTLDKVLPKTLGSLGHNVEENEPIEIFYHKRGENDE